MEPLRSRINTISVKLTFIALPSHRFDLTCLTDKESIALLITGRVASQATFRSAFLRPNRILIKGKESLVDFKDIVLAPRDKVLHD